MVIPKPLIWLVATLVILAAGWGGYEVWNAKREKKEGELRASVDGARIVQSKFVAAADIRVGVLEGKALGTGTFNGRIFTSTQRTLAPFTSEYFISLKKINAGDYRWDNATHTLTINLPDVWEGKPNIDMTKAVTRQTGKWISREAGLALNRQVATTMTAKIDQAASEKKHKDVARENARGVIVRLAQQILVGADVPDAKVAVSFPWEPKSIGGPRWDQSRSPEEVLKGR